MSTDRTALVLDDEEKVRFFLARTLELTGYNVKPVATGSVALELLRDTSFDVAILDLNLGGRVSGMQVLQAIRWRWPDTIVIILTGYATLESAMKAIQEGVDGYLQKPVSHEEVRQLIADARERRQQRAANRSSDTLASGPFQLDLIRHQASCAGHLLDLTPTEYALLAYLVEHAGEVHTPQTLVKVVRGYDCETHREAREIIKWHIHKLRQKIEPDPQNPQFLQNVRGVGYTLQTQATAT
ncbi:MAG: response regulator transcription factor [Anaerolineae bacterium]|nr:response regulator transcription factor [Anaerolineae bacterium]